LRDAGVAERCEIVEGSFFDSVPYGADAYLLSQVLHDWDDTNALNILRICREAMRPGALLLVVDHVLPPGNPNAWSVFMDLNMFVLFGGRERGRLPSALARDIRGIHWAN
jgi:predicted O-methyltransferase YrrM